MRTRFDTTPAIIREVNHIPPRMLLKAGSTILVDNLASRALLRRLGFHTRGREADVLELALDLVPCSTALAA